MCSVIQSLKLYCRHIAGLRILCKKSVSLLVFTAVILISLVIFGIKHGVYMKSMFDVCTDKVYSKLMTSNLNISLVPKVKTGRFTTNENSQLTKSNSSKSSQVTSLDILELANDLRVKLALAQHVTDIDNITSRCQQLGLVYPGECNATVSGERCLHAAIPDDVITRVEHLVLNERLQVPEIYRRAIQRLSDQLDRDYDVIIVGAVSSNHFLEFQPMIKGVHELILPFLKDVRLVIFDLGLEEGERKLLEKHCRCTVIKFNFDEFPPHFTTFKCFGWKPVVVKAAFTRANVVIWADASVRFTAPEVLSDMIAKAKLQGVIQRRPKFNISNPYFTIPQMFEYFGDSPCAHLPFNQVESGFGIYHREPLIEKALIDPWVACALRPECTCPEQQRALQKCPHQWDPLKFGHCMRNDQSSLTIILAKLFREKFFHFVLHTDGKVNIRRGDKLNYFKRLDREIQARTNSSNV